MRGLQADHKVPLSRGGTNDLSNWQAICNTCNVIKRRACQGCSIDCQTCAWAHPVEGTESVVLSLSSSLLKSLGLDSLNAQTRASRIIDLLESSFAKPNR
ncbi:MAG: HNH endonuclease signature motif containing protein [bacterium]|nr:HNH endonuclease signature motif containing protein [bacterium]